MKTCDFLNLPCASRKRPGSRGHLASQSGMGHGGQNSGWSTQEYPKRTSKTNGPKWPSTKKRLNPQQIRELHLLCGSTVGGRRMLKQFCPIWSIVSHPSRYPHQPPQFLLPRPGSSSMIRRRKGSHLTQQEPCRKLTPGLGPEYNRVGAVHWAI